MIMTRFKPIPMLLLTAAMLGAVLSAGCNGNARVGSASSRSKKDPSRMTPGELQQFVSTNAAIAGANAGIQMTQLPTAPQPPAVPAVSPPGVTPAIVLPERTVVTAMRVASHDSTRRSMLPALKISNITSSAPFEREDEAQTDALRVAAIMIEDRLQQLDPPIVTTVSRNRIWNEYVVHSTARAVPLKAEEAEELKKTAAGANRTYYQIDVEISEPQLRELRAEGRIKKSAPFVFGGLVAAMGASLLLRLTGAAAAVVRRA
jgi:hypothetical protein